MHISLNFLILDPFLFYRISDQHFLPIFRFKTQTDTHTSNIRHAWQKRYAFNRESRFTAFDCFVFFFIENLWLFPIIAVRTMCNVLASLYLLKNDHLAENFVSVSVLFLRFLSYVRKDFNKELNSGTDYLFLFVIIIWMTKMGL